MSEPVYGAIASGADSVFWPDPKSGPWRVHCQWTNIDGYTRLTGMSIEGIERLTKSGGVTMPTLTASVVASLPLNRVADQVLEKVRATFEAFNIGPPDDVEIMGRHVSGGKTGRPPLSYDDLEQVAAIYRNGGANPTKAVADALNISRSAAAKRVAKARSPEVGLLEPTSQGRAGGTKSTKARKR